MKKKYYRIGEEIIFDKDFEIEKCNGEILTVKANDKAIVTSRGIIQYTSGNAKNMRQVTNDIELNGYDHINISKHILRRLNAVFNLEEFTEYEGIQFSQIIDEIEDVLRDIL